MTEWDSKLWEEVDDLLSAALEEPHDRRIEFVRASGATARVMERVIALLGSAPDADERIGESAESLARDLFGDADPPRDDDLSPGDEVGPYTIVRELGRGGMGTVYLADQADERYSRRVALKLVKRGMDTDEVVARFRREARILARLEHHGIARMYDAGGAPDGRPYLVMEFVDGHPIDVHCDAAGLSVEARLRIALEVCEAVSFAHQQLVLHRDLKPSNILVSSDGPKLVDFGVAKVLGGEDESGSELTRIEGRRLTPEYASPEQLAGGEVSTASDVYSLGAVTYELLTGTRPGPRETRPPSAIATHGSEDETRRRAATRASTPRRLARNLAGDLDVILLKALHEDPARRYPSIEALAEDIRRHLGGLPVAARPDSVPYRLRKFLTRNPWPVLSGSGVAVSVLVFGIGSFIQQRETARERDRADLQRERAEQIADVLEEMFTGAGFESGQRVDTMTVRTFLDRSADRVIADLEGQPVVQGSLLRVLGNAQHALGRLDAADSLLTRSVGVLEAADERDGRALLEAKRDLGHVYQRRGMWGAALPLYEEWLAEEGELDPAAEAEVRHNMAVALFQMGHLDSAVVKQDSTIALHRAHPELDPLGFAAALTMRAGMAQRQGDVEAAIAFAAEAKDRAASALGPGHPQRFAFEQNHALMVFRGGDPEQAEALFSDITRRYRAEIGESVELSSLLRNFGNVLREVGRLSEALALVEEALALDRRFFGDRHPNVTASLDALGSTLTALDRPREALAAFEEQLATSLSVFGPDHPNTGIAHMKTASARCLVLGPAAEAEAGFDAADRILTASFAADHPLRSDLSRRREACRSG